MLKGSPGEATYTQNIALTCSSGLLTVIRNQEGVNSTSVQDREADKKSLKQIQVTWSQLCLDALKDQFLLKVTLETASLTLRAKPSTPKVGIPSVPDGFGHFQIKPIELVYTLQGRKWIMLHSTEAAAGFKEAKQSTKLNQ